MLGMKTIRYAVNYLHGSLLQFLWQLGYVEGWRCGAGRRALVGCAANLRISNSLDDLKLLRSQENSLDFFVLILIFLRSRNTAGVYFFVLFL